MDLSDDQANRLENLILNTQNLQNLHDQFENYSNDEIRKKYIMVAKERNVYFDKLRSIEKYGELNNWKDKSGLLKKIVLKMNKLKSKED